MKKAYFEPEFDLFKFKFGSVLNDDDDDTDATIVASDPEGQGQGVL